MNLEFVGKLIMSPELPELYKLIDGPVIRVKPKIPKIKTRLRKRYIPPKDNYWRIGFKLPGSLKQNEDISNLVVHCQINS